MRYRELLELYSEPNKHLLGYLKSSDFDAYSHWWEVSRTIIEKDKFRRAMSRVLKRKITSIEDLEEEEPDVFYKLPKDIQTAIGQDVTNWLLQHNPAESPSAAHFSVQQQAQLLPRLTWLVHFTDYPEDIATQGFTKGVADVNKLGLTNYVGDYDKKYGGYNFAFVVNSRDAEIAATYHNGNPKYGKHAVMFQNSGVKAYHYGDEENQVIFWGADVQTRDMIVLKNNFGDWAVMARTFYYKDKTPSFDKELYKGEDFEKCSQWVMKHFQQYRKALTGF